MRSRSYHTNEAEQVEKQTGHDKEDSRYKMREVYYCLLLLLSTHACQRRSRTPRSDNPNLDVRQSGNPIDHLLVHDRPRVSCCNCGLFLKTAADLCKSRSWTLHGRGHGRCARYGPVSVSRTLSIQKLRPSLAQTRKCVQRDRWQSSRSS